MIERDIVENFFKLPSVISIVSGVAMVMRIGIERTLDVSHSVQWLGQRQAYQLPVSKARRRPGIAETKGTIAPHRRSRETFRSA